MRRHLIVLLAAAVGLVVIASLLGDTSTAGSSPLSPGADPFYAYSGSPLAHGSVLKSRSVDLSLGTSVSTPVRAEQLLYATTDELGHPSATVTTILEPLLRPAAPHLVEYLSFYDGLGPLCDPSYTLSGGNSGSSTYQNEATEEELLIAYYLAQGDVLTIPDFEGTGLHWMAGLESGQSALDAVTATESFLSLASSTEVGMSGYSGGSVAADWASEIAAAYAPAVNVVGVAEGGIPAN